MLSQIVSSMYSGDGCCHGWFDCTDGGGFVRDGLFDVQMEMDVVTDGLTVHRGWML